MSTLNIEIIQRLARWLGIWRYVTIIASLMLKNGILILSLKEVKPYFLDFSIHTNRLDTAIKDTSKTFTFS